MKKTLPVLLMIAALGVGPPPGFLALVPAIFVLVPRAGAAVDANVDPRSAGLAELIRAAVQ